MRWLLLPTLVLAVGCGDTREGGDAGSADSIAAADGLDSDAPPDADPDAPLDADSDAPSDADSDAPPDADSDAPPDADSDAPPDADSDAPPEDAADDADEGLEVADAPDAIALPACVDRIESPTADGWSATAEGDYPTTLTVLGAAEALFGSVALRADATAPFAWSLALATSLDLADATSLAFAVRAENVNSPTWQGDFPIVSLVDGAERRLVATPARGGLLPTDGLHWRRLAVPVDGHADPDWAVAVDPGFDRADVRRVTFAADTWGAGFRLDLDGLMAVGPACEAPCPCGAHGACLAAGPVCACALGRAGERCERCADGWVADGLGCRLANPGEHTTWPNADAPAASDPWLAAHHAALTRLEPTVAVLDFVNVSTPAADRALVDAIIAGFAEGSRERGDELPTTPVLAYRLLAGHVIDLRDGVDGRPPAPADWPYQNSTLYPRRPADEPGYWRFDYATLYEPAFAAHYGVVDPDEPSRYLGLCELAERGLVHEVWVVGSGDVPDVNAAEVLEHKALWDAQGNRIGGFDACAGNGCFDSDVPHCAVSLRVGWVNFNRGPGCYLHSQGHAVESTGRGPAVPALREWFMPLAGLDLDTRWGLPFPSFYGVGCPAPPCIDHPTATSLLVHTGDAVVGRDPFDPVCGNVHFPPNGESHYDYANPDPVSSSCRTFGRGDVRALIGRDDWAANSAWPDCGGEFMVWWFQRMPGPSAERSFADGRPMPSLWPFLFY